ncbi:hypothetical protein [Pectobacterium brasiliense]|uniref:hypothetical protein n=1 Tax=Pectobacterium brasiliense TaxID=180957 RepID=UPI001968B5E6|nr:hypothetical protein [Pectobacterium brasiliense]
MQWLFCEKMYPMENYHFFDQKPLDYDALSDDVELVFFRAMSDCNVTLAFTRKWKNVQGVINIPIIKIYRVLREWELPKTKNAKYLSYSQKQVESLTDGSVFPSMVVDNYKSEYKSYQDFLAD